MRLNRQEKMLLLDLLESRRWRLAHTLAKPGASPVMEREAQQATRQQWQATLDSVQALIARFREGS